MGVLGGGIIIYKGYSDDAFSLYNDMGFQSPGGRCGIGRDGIGEGGIQWPGIYESGIDKSGIYEPGNYENRIVRSGIEEVRIQRSGEVGMVACGQLLGYLCGR